MNLTTLLNYAEQLRCLRTSYTRKNRQAPHKFILFLSLMVLYDLDYLKDYHIEFSDEILKIWQKQFHHEWAKWVRSEHFQPNFAQPLYYSRNETFWRFHLKNETATQLGKSLKNLREAVDFIELDNELAALFKQPETRQILREVLLARLFEIA